MTKRPTMTDIALAAGVSQATVSLVLNEVPNARVSADTRARVKEVAQSLGYVRKSAPRLTEALDPGRTRLHEHFVLELADTLADSDARVLRVQVDAADSMRFTPALVDVKKGETVRFVVTNSGKVPHEFSLGTEKELKEHYEVMKKFPGMEHDEANKISLKPGQKGEVIWRFTKGGVVDFACLHPGHYDAGMKGQIKVTTK